MSGGGSESSTNTESESEEEVGADDTSISPSPRPAVEQPATSISPSPRPAVEQPVPHRARKTLGPPATSSTELVLEQPPEATSVEAAVPEPRPKRSPSYRLPRERAALLREVFGVFDIDGSGSVDAQELRCLGRARKTLGQKERVWSEEKNHGMLGAMDKNHDGTVEEMEFLRYFGKALRELSDEAFRETMEAHVTCTPKP